MMKVISLLFILIFTLAYAGISCVPPGSQLGSERDNDDDDDDDDDDRRSTRTCSDRDSCQDICDDMFNYTSEHSRCYDLSYDDVNTISRVWDEFSRGEVRSDELEDLDPDDLRAYLEIGMESFIDLVKGEEVGDSAKDANEAQWDDESKRENNSNKIMKWIAEEDNIAEVFLEQDRNFELGLALFQTIAIGEAPGGSQRVGPTMHICLNEPNNTIVHNNSTITFDNGNRRCTPSNPLLSLADFGIGKDVREILSGFIKTSGSTLFSGDSFMTFAADERNEKAFEWGHKTILEFCKEATDENEEDVEVKTCLQAVYCIHRTKEMGGSFDNSKEGIFKSLEDYDDIVGRTDAKYCADLDDEDRMEDLFD